MKKLLTSILLVIGLTGGEVFSQVSTDGLVGYWPFNGNANDESGNGLNGSVFGATLTSDRFGNENAAFHFNGTGDTIGVLNTSVMNTLPLTISAWVKPALRSDATWFPPNAICNDNPGSSGKGFGINVFPGGSHFNVLINESQNIWFWEIPGLTFQDGEWYHVAIVYSPGNAMAYINGALVGSISYYQDESDGYDVIRFGNHNHDAGYGTRRFYKGDMDEIRIYNRALTGEEVLILFNEGDWPVFPYVNPVVDITLNLEGPFLPGEFTSMRTDLNDNGMLPLSQPFGPELPYLGNEQPVWHYLGQETLETIPENMVDWVLVELRDAPKASQAYNSTVVARQAAILLSTGKVVNTRGEPLTFSNVAITKGLFVAVYHRNHIGMMSSGSLTYSNGVFSWNFGEGSFKAFGEGQKVLGDGFFGMYGGDGDGNGQVQTQDKNNVWNPQSGQNDYLAGDFDMNGQVQTQDKNNIWNPNSGISSSIPGDFTGIGDGLPCPGMPTITDPRNGQTYHTLQLGDQCWLKENLNWLPEVYPPTEGSVSVPLYYVYDYLGVNVAEAMLTENYQNYGVLYNWPAAIDACPTGWHLPSDSEWTLMEYHLTSTHEEINPDNVALKLKSCRQVDSPLGGECATSEHPRWIYSASPSGTDDFGFSAYGGGDRRDWDDFTWNGDIGFWWTSTSVSSTTAWSRNMKSDRGSIHAINYWSKEGGYSVRCVRDLPVEPVLYQLNIQVQPEGSGIVSGSGQYQEGQQIDLSAIPNAGYRFVNWTEGTTVISTLASWTYTMPAGDVILIANFELENNIDGQPCPGMPTYTDARNGQTYSTVQIGGQCWLKENLNWLPEVYPPTDGSVSVPRYYVYDYLGTNVGEALLSENYQNYGVLYNWPAAINACPTGWHLPSDSEWTLMEYHLTSTYEEITPENVALKLKSCRQVDSPLGGECATSEHPRWNSYNNFPGTDDFGFSAFGGGDRTSFDFFNNFGNTGFWWSSTSVSDNYAWSRYIIIDRGDLVHVNYWLKEGGYSVRCIRDIPVEPILYQLNIEVQPEGSGIVTGAGQYEEGQQVNLTATSNAGYHFVNWTEGGTIIGTEVNLTYVMPAGEVTLISIFELDTSGDGQPCPGMATYTDPRNGQTYSTVQIGDQCWMREHLNWLPEVYPPNIDSNTEPRYYVFDYYGTSVPEAIATANYQNYGVLYNWPAAAGACPAGWHLPSYDEFNQLPNYLITNYEGVTLDNVADKLKSCRQINSPLGDECATEEHPRWMSDPVHYGTDDFNFSAHAGGDRRSFDDYSNLGGHVIWWLSTDVSANYAWCVGTNAAQGNFSYKDFWLKEGGYSVRCVKDITTEPVLYQLNIQVQPEGSGIVSGSGQYQEGQQVSLTALPNEGFVFVDWTDEGTIISTESNYTFTMPAVNTILQANFEGISGIGDPVTDIEGNVYPTVIIGPHRWMALNLKTTTYNDGTPIPNVKDNAQWQGLGTGAWCYFDNNDVTPIAVMGKLYNWYAVNTGNLCPVGWHVSTDEEWKYLEGYADSQYGIGNEVWDLFGYRGYDAAIKIKANESWTPQHGIDSYGFRALAGGFRTVTGSFLYIGTYGFWWTLNESSSLNALNRQMDPDIRVVRNSVDKNHGFSVRCVED